MIVEYNRNKYDFDTGYGFIMYLVWLSDSVNSRAIVHWGLYCICSQFWFMRSYFLSNFCILDIYNTFMVTLQKPIPNSVNVDLVCLIKSLPYMWFFRTLDIDNASRIFCTIAFVNSPLTMYHITLWITESLQGKFFRI